MADKNPTSPRSRRSSRGTSRNKLRRNNEVQHVVVEEPFVFNEPKEGSSAGERKVGEGCYVSATINTRRLYGVLVDQSVLKSATMLHFQDQASGLHLNRRMQIMKEHHKKIEREKEVVDGKRPASGDLEENHGNKKQKTAENHENEKQKTAIPDATSSKNASLSLSAEDRQQVQKFRYVDKTVSNGRVGSADYRVLLATYADIDAASEDDVEKGKKIEAACKAGGDFVGGYYYQYEVISTALEISDYAKKKKNDGMRLSLGFETFLQSTPLPAWFPLSNLQIDQQKILNILNVKKDNSGNIVYDDRAVSVQTNAKGLQGTTVPMEPRMLYRVCVVGGGIAGLSCCLEIFRQSEREGINVEVVLLEGRSRLGGRLWTDRETFKTEDGKEFPVDLGASWIHGIELNPLAALAKEAGADFVTASEEVKMFQSGMEEVDKASDDRAGKLFDKLLDLAAEDSWESEDVAKGGSRSQAAVRWYASVLSGPSIASQDGDSQSQRDRRPAPNDAPPYRQSSDISVDHAVGNTIAKHLFSEFAKVSEQERRMLLWNLKNVEYALGANISDLSMKFWDIDERHAFEGDHVILKQGYSVIVDHLLRELKQRGELFKCMLDFSVGKLEYSRKSGTQPYFGSSASRFKQLVDLSDTCCVASQDSQKKIKCDFVVCTVPLGCLKEAIAEEDNKSKMTFVPPLPFSKRDAIESVGFGLLDKLYLQFPFAFWRGNNILDTNQAQFGNASGVNPHHYMFLDIGKSLTESSDSAPAILMSLVSGNEAVDCEWLSDDAFVSEAMVTIRTLFSKIDVPDPIAFRRTRWGSDKFSRGSYTFLPPGTTDQDFQLLQAPVNGNGVSLLLEGSETMRLFFAGEHTTALHPSMAHGAMLSGIRAAKEVLAAVNFSFQSDDNIDRLIPMPLFRHLNPKTKLSCMLCGLVGNRVREGSLLAFKKGPRQVVVHNNCAENSPEVEVVEGQFRHVLKAVNRSRHIICVLCGQNGATIGCAEPSCGRCYHFSCAEDTGWRFDLDGKEFYCDLHSKGYQDDCAKISMNFFRSKQPAGGNVICSLCGDFSDDTKAGDMLAFRRGSRLAAVHEKCIKFTTIVDTRKENVSRFDHDYRNVFTAIDNAKICARCGRRGATLECSNAECTLCYHFGCADDLGLNPQKRALKFRCLQHLEKASLTTNGEPTPKDPWSNALFHHALFSAVDNGTSTNVPGNLDIGGEASAVKEPESISSPETSDSEGDQRSTVGGDDNARDRLLTSHFESDVLCESRLVRIFRKSRKDRWNIELIATPTPLVGKSYLSVAACKLDDPFDGLKAGDVVTAINGVKVGSFQLNSLSKVISRFGQEIEIMLEIQREL